MKNFRKPSFLRKQKFPLIISCIILLLCLFTACEKWTLDRIPVNCTNFPENCVNGTCINDVCVCNTGWYGENCTSQNPADSTSVALNCDGIDCGENGVCINGICECEDFYWGDNCEEEVITFEKTFGGSEWDIGRSVVQTNDGGFIITGDTQSFGAGNGDVYLIKTDVNGNEQWSKTFGGSYIDFGYCIAQTIDGGFIITGYTWSFGAGGNNVYLIKTDANGNEQWSKTFGGSNDDSGSSVAQTTDGGFIITGYTTSFGTGDEDVYLIKIDADGNEQWYKTFGGSEDDRGVSITQTADGGFIITGSTESFGAGGNNVYLIKTDANGNEQWSKTFGGSDYDTGNSVAQTTDGGFIITGSTESFGADFYDVYLIKIDANGNEQWSKIFGGNGLDSGGSITQTADDGFIITGITLNISSQDIYLIKTDANGNEQWTKMFGGSISEFGNSVIQTTDGGFIITGSTESFGAGDRDVYLIKTDANGNVQ